MNQQPTFYFHDYETWGADPKRDRPAQFAGIRTDLDLNIISEPDIWYCQLANDYLPHPQAALITGITPQLCQRKGLPENEFMQRILSRFAESGTCVTGYNNLRFDDEITRYSLYRNFFDPYAREWQNGNSRWDIIDMVRACYALRPDGINWPQHENGNPSFKLEHLTKANGIEHQQAHDAMSDVYATIAMAKLIKEKQPRLFHYLFELRRKNKVSELIDVASMKPLVHVSSKFPASQGCTSLIVPLAWHPVNKNAVICYNLQADPQLLISLDSDTLKTRLYSRSTDLAEGEQRPGLKLIHLNKCPVLAPLNTLTESRATALGISLSACMENQQWLQQNLQVQQIATDLFSGDHGFAEESNPDYQLYSGFISNGDKQKAEYLHQLTPQQLAADPPIFADERLNNLLFLYRARLYPASLTDAEQQKWQRYRTEKLMHGLDNPSLTMDAYGLELENLAHEHSADEQKMAVLKALYLYAQSL